MVKPVIPTTGRLRPLGADEVRLTPGFWGDLQTLNAEAIIEHCRSWEERLGWIDNFRSPGLPHQGREFSDSEIYKLLEGMCWETGRAGGTDLSARIDELSETIAGAQEPDGYLNTRWHGDRYADLEWGHELYCYGHLIQAGVAALRTGTGDLLAEVARRAADHVCSEFAEGRNEGVCGHPEIEMALVELFRATGESRYLEQARLFVERRGRPALADIHLGRSYFQDDMPVREATVFRGHAVRALYLASGVVDLAVETGDDDLLATVIEQFDRTVAARTYLTGGMGSRHSGEAFGEDWELPSDRSYSETCAAVASVQLCWRLLLATGDPRYADLAERTLYNVIATSPARDGHGFFYANPLQVRVPGRLPDPDVINPRVESPLRAPWFSVACCPNNLARTFASLGGHLATADAGGIQIQQITPCTIDTALPDGRRVALRVETGYPWSGAVTVRVEHADQVGCAPWRLSIRIPPWAGRTERYVTEEREFRPGDELRLDLPMEPRWTRPDPRIDAVRGCVAVERGPLVYCAESLGDDPPLSDLRVDTSSPPVEVTDDANPGGNATGGDGDLGGDATGGEGDLGGDATGGDGDLGGGADLGGVRLSVPARMVTADRPWPYGDPVPASAAAESATLVPYHQWGNRGPATMRVWLPEDPSP